MSPSFAIVKRSSPTLVVLSLLCVVVPCLQAQTIGLFLEADPAPEPPGFVQVPPRTPTLLYVVAHAGAASLLQDGVLGSELRVVTSPQTEQLVITSTPNPQALLVQGDPLAGGGNLTFGGCAAPSANQAVLLYTLEVTALTPVFNVVLSIEHKLQPSSPALPYPLLMACGDAFAPVISSGSALVVNPTVPAETGTWSAIKSQFR